MVFDQHPADPVRTGFHGTLGRCCQEAGNFKGSWGKFLCSCTLLSTVTRSRFQELSCEAVVAMTTLPVHLDGGRPYVHMKVSRWIRTGHLHRSGASDKRPPLRVTPTEVLGGNVALAAVWRLSSSVFSRVCTFQRVFKGVCSVLKRPAGAEGSRAPAIRTTGVAHELTGGMHGHTFRIHANDVPAVSHVSFSSCSHLFFVL